MGKRDYYNHGDYNVICDVCGQKFKASECQMRWDNLLVCHNDFEIRHPQDFVRGRTDDQRVPIPRPRTPLKFVEDIT